MIHWIARQVAGSRQDYCYRESYGRGVGAPLSTCHEDEDKNGLLCYPKCREGFHGVGPVCWERCPEDYTDMGVSCLRPAATEHITVKPSNCSPGFTNTGVACVNKKLDIKPISHSDCEPGLHREGAFCYSDCRPGFVNTGVSCFRSVSSITKKTYVRGVGTPMYCKPGTDNDAGLCYSYCRENFHGVGPVCWERCPSDRVNCGAGCATSKNACASNIASMVVAPAMLAWNIATFGSTAELTGWYKTIADGLKVASTVGAAANVEYQIAMATNRWVTDVSTVYFEQLTTPTVTKELEARFHGDALTWIKREYALNHLHVMLMKDLDETALNGLSAVSGYDPTGITGVLAAFANPICVFADPFPNVTVH